MLSAAQPGIFRQLLSSYSLCLYSFSPQNTSGVPTLSRETLYCQNLPSDSHKKMLIDCMEGMEEFLDAMVSLGERLGPSRRRADSPRRAGAALGPPRLGPRRRDPAVGATGAGTGGGRTGAGRVRIF